VFTKAYILSEKLVYHKTDFFWSLIKGEASHSKVEYTFTAIFSETSLKPKYFHVKFHKKPQDKPDCKPLLSYVNG